MRHYQARGVRTVEMESAALFSVSDSLADLVWDTHFDGDATCSGLEALHTAALKALDAPP